jgi:hypothetical protein
LVDPCYTLVAFLPLSQARRWRIQLNLPTSSALAISNSTCRTGELRTGSRFELLT